MTSRTSTESTRFCYCCCCRQQFSFSLSVKLISDGPSFLYENSYENLGTRNLPVCHKVLVPGFSRTRNLDELEHWLSATEVFWHSGALQIGLLLLLYYYSVRETWSHVIEILCRYWSEVRYVFLYIFCCWLLLVVSSFSSFLPSCWLWSVSWKKKLKFEILNRLCHPPCFLYENLSWFCMRLVSKFLYQNFRMSFSYKKLGPSAISFRDM